MDMGYFTLVCSCAFQIEKITFREDTSFALALNLCEELEKEKQLLLEDRDIISFFDDLRLNPKKYLTYSGKTARDLSKILVETLI